MRPAPIPDELMGPDDERIVFAPPDGDLTNANIGPVEVLKAQVEEIGTVFSIRCVLEDGDLTRMAEGGVVWLSFVNIVPVFSLQVGP